MSFLYSIYDLKAEHYLPVMEGTNDEHAKRTVAQAIAQGIPVAQYPEDYELYRLCTYDQNTGYITQDTRPERVASVLEILSQYNLGPAGASAGAPHSPINGASPSAPSAFDPKVEASAADVPETAEDQGDG